MAKQAVIDTSLSVLAGKTNLQGLSSTLEKHNEWDTPISFGKSSLKEIVNEVFALDTEFTT